MSFLANHKAHATVQGKDLCSATSLSQYRFLKQSETVFPFHFPFPAVRLLASFYTYLNKYTVLVDDQDSSSCLQSIHLPGVSFICVGWTVFQLWHLSPSNKVDSSGVQQFHATILQQFPITVMIVHEAFMEERDIGGTCMHHSQINSSLDSF